MIPKWEYMNRLYDTRRKDDSNRCRVGSYAYDTSDALTNVHDVVEVMGNKSQYGPGLGDKFTADTVRREVNRIERRAGRWGVPVAIKWYGNDVFQLIEMEREATDAEDALPSNRVR
jgi:hypothetical protein